MAVFNPNVPQGKDEMPDWTKVTHPISDIQPDKSTGLALATIGQGIEGGAGILETAVKDIINKDVRNTVEPIREDFSNQVLQTKRDMLSGSADLDLMQGVGPTGPVQPKSVPAGIDVGLRKVDRIQNLLQYGSGKLGVDETYYDMRLKTAVTDLRRMYPGFVDYIDQRVSAITGINPANELISDTNRQIAQLQSSKKTEYDKEVDLARNAMKENMRGAKEQFETLLQQGPAYLPTWRNWYESEGRKWKEISERDILRKDKQADEAVDKDTRTKDWTNYVSAEVSTAMGTTLSITGLSDKKKLTDFIEEFRTNPDKFNSEQIRQLATMVQAQGAQIGARIDAEASKIDVESRTGKRYSYNSDIGAEEVQRVKSNIMKYFDNMHNALMKQDGGLAFLWAQRAAGMMDNTKYEVYAGPEGETLRRFEILKNSVGEQAVPNLLTDAIKQGIDKSVNKLFEKNMLSAKTQTTPEGKPAEVPYTFKDMNDEALSKEKNSEITKAIRARYINGGFNVMLKDITDKDSPDPAKFNAIKFFFSPEGQGVLNSFNNDRYNPITNKDEPGRQTIWNRLTSDEVSESIKKLSKRYPEIGVMYTNWITKEAGSTLFYKDLQNLQTITGRDDLWIKYYDKKVGGPRIELMSDKGALESPIGKQIPYNAGGIPKYGSDRGIDIGRRQPYSGQIELAKQSIERVNLALRGVERVYSKFGGDTDAMLISFMNNAQVDMGKNWEGLPAKIMDAIAAAQGRGKLKDLFEQQKEKGK